jgi:hypothetical protein
MRGNRLIATRLIGLGLGLSLLPALSALGSTTVTFDTLNGGDSGTTVNSYLAGFGITVTSGSVQIQDDRTFVFPPPSTPIVQASSGHMFLVGNGANSQLSFTLGFSPVLTSLSFTRIFETCNNAGTAYPGWQATAYQGATALGTVGPGTSTYSIFPPNTLPAQTYTFDGTGISSIRFDCYGNNFAAFSSVFVDDIQLSQVPEPATLGMLSLSVGGLLVRRKRAGR